MYLALSPQAAVHTPGCPCTVASSQHPLAEASHNTQNIHPQVLSQAKDKSPPLAAQHSLFLGPLQARVPHTGRHLNPSCHPLVASPFPAHTLKSHHTVRATHPAPLSRSCSHHTLVGYKAEHEQPRQTPHPHATARPLQAAPCHLRAYVRCCMQRGYQRWGMYPVKGPAPHPLVSGSVPPSTSGPLPAAAAGPACQTPQMSPGHPGADLGLSCLCEALNSTCAAGWLHSCLGVCM